MRTHLVRNFSTSSALLGRTGVSIVPPVHQLIRFKKSQLSDKARPPKSWVTSAGFRPQITRHDRLRQHYNDTLASDLLLLNYTHNETTVEGARRKPRAPVTPYSVYQPSKPLPQHTQPTKDIKPRTSENIPHLERISINCFAKPAIENRDLAITAKVMLQHITGMKPRDVFAKTNLPMFHLRPGMPVGAKVEITGEAMSQFVSTLTELVLPRSRTFRNISGKCGDGNGNIGLKLTKHDITLFPELENSLELWPETFDIDLIVHTSAQTDREARTLLSGLGFPVSSEIRK